MTFEVGTVSSTTQQNIPMNQNQTGYTTGGVRALARFEGFVFFVFAVLAYDFLNFPFGLFVLCFFVPDLALFAYFINNRVGSIAYNITHSYVIPLCLFAFGFYIDSSNIYKFAIIWIAHVGFDRALGFGLKYARGFRYTHLGKIGHSESATH